MEYTLIRSGRKSISIQLTAEGDVVVRAPKRCPRASIDQFVQSKSGWIERHQATLQQQAALRDSFSLHTGDSFFLCGRPVQVRICPGMEAALRDGQLILPSGNMEQARPALLALCRRISEPWLRQRLDFWAVRMGLDYRALKLSNARRRWGSCTRDGVIRISVFLLFAPERAVEYVLVHELAHRRYFDHSPGFWRVVAEAMPDYAEQRKALRVYQQTPLVQSLAK